MEEQGLDKCGIYCITCIVNGKRYVGQTTVSFRKRWMKHKSDLNNNMHCNVYLQRSWNKFGISSFTFEILEICVEALNDAEVFWIYTLTTLNRKHGYNLRHGGENGRISQETKNKMSKAHIGNRHSQETKNKISKAFTGKSNHCYGKRRSQESKDKISKAHIGKRTQRNSSGYVCVTFDRQKNRWMSYVSIGGKRNYLGRFPDPIQAAKAYDKASFAHYGRTDILNFPEDYINSSADFLCPHTELNDNKKEKKHEQKEAV